MFAVVGALGGGLQEHFLHSVLQSSSQAPAAGPSALTQPWLPQRDFLQSRALAKKSGAGSDTELAEDKVSR